MTKGRNIKNFLKSQPLFDVHRQYVWTFLTDLQVEVPRFRCRIFHCFAYSAVSHETAFLYISNPKCTGAQLWNSQTGFKLKKKHYRCCKRRQFMGVTFSIPDFDVDNGSECYLRERGCFFEILRNLASF